MKIHNLRNTIHSINLKKSKKTAVLCISALFIISMLVFPLSVQARVIPTVQQHQQLSVQARVTPTVQQHQHRQSTRTPTPTQQPTATPTPMNLVPTPTWTYPGNGQVGYWSNDVWDTSVLYNGAESIKIEPIGSSGNTARECDGPGISCNVGDNIVFSAWIKTDISSLGDNGLDDKGARIGIDFYTDSGFSGISALVNGVGNDAVHVSGCLQASGSFVPWNTTSWTQQEINCTVPSGYGITGFIPWLQVLDTTDTGNAWFANTQMYINP